MLHLLSHPTSKSDSARPLIRLETAGLGVARGLIEDFVRGFPHRDDRDREGGATEARTALRGPSGCEGARRALVSAIAAHALYERRGGMRRGRAIPTL